ncbi:MAG: threonine--tRNA ligase [Deltaproteobacteria bacterium]|nr:threonine--tRNA ligase [Deltaproteobacteria bacterium]
MVCRPGHENDPVEKMRHSAAHILADAVTRLYPDAKPTIGPVIENGFYYDFDYPPGFSEDDLEKIEAEMKKIIKENQKFERIDMSRDDALKMFKENGETYKLEILQSIPEGEDITFYKHGEFVDLCKGPHANYTKQVKAIKLLSVAGAYWRGDENNAMLQRIYGTAFASKEDLANYLEQLEEAKKRDHRKLGKELEIFTFDDEVGPGLPLWLPNGGAMIDALEELAKKTERKAGYHRVRTPHITKETMYYTSGHLPYYEESMYPAMELEGIKYYLKPMNCPHHHKIFAAKARSYRDLPVRLAEYGTCYRYEKSGELFGLMRVRSMQMNDAHIYCTLDQFQDEFLAVCRMYQSYFKLFGIQKYQMRLSTHSKEGLGKKYVDQPELWIKTEDMVRNALKAGDIPFVEVENEAAFYGPKIDVQIWSAIGREFTLATNQVDFAVPERFGLSFKNSKNEDEVPLCIHRAPLSTHERLIGFLIEHYAGAFPLWLAPVQAKVLSVSEDQHERALAVQKQLTDAGYRVEADLRNEKLGLKIREAQLMKVPYMLIVGKKDAEANLVGVRHRKDGDLGSLAVPDLLQKLTDEMKEFDIE